MTLSVGNKLGPYEILSPLGAGGMGEVYRARDTRLDREVAIKVLPERTARDEHALSRFRRETKALAAISHPNILMILDVGEHEGVSYAVMELLEGETLRQRLHGMGIDSHKALEIAAAVADGLAAAHARDIIHRDLKPENLFLTRDGVVKILDFGLARTGLYSEPNAATVTAMTQAGVVLGTVNYMSPEQVRAEPAGARSDIFSLGCVLYEMLTGKPPFIRETSPETMTAILRHHPKHILQTTVDVPSDVDPIVMRCLAKVPEDRFNSARDLAFSLRSAMTHTGEHRVRRRTRRLSWMAVGVVGLIALTAGVFYATRERPASSADALDSIAVLPFVNASGDPDQEYFVDGMTEALIADLAKIRALKVISRTSAMQFKGVKKPLPEIAKQLNVEAVVEGSVLRAGDRVRITAQLIHAGTDEHLWAESYDRDLSDILRLQGEVARAIAQEIKVTLTPQEQARMSAARPVNPDAYQAYLRGRFHWHNREREGMQKAIEYFHRAIELDPDYAPAYAGLADSYTHQARHGHVSPKEAFLLAKQAARKSVQLDPASAEAHAALAAIALYFDWDWTIAERELHQALDLNPSFEEAHHQYSHLLLTVGRPQESLIESQWALDLNPLDPLLNMHLGWHYMMTRQFDLSIAQLKSVLEINANHYQTLRHIGWAYMYTNLHAEAITALETATRLDDTAQAMTSLAAAYARAGRSSDARVLLSQLEASLPSRYVSACDLAAAYAALHETKVAIDWLEKAVEERSPRIIELAIDPVFDPLRDDPRFAGLVRSVGLPTPKPTASGTPSPATDNTTQVGALPPTWPGGDKGGSSDGKIMLAVLPFENLSRDPDQEYFSDGLTEEMITQLGRINPKKLGVIARSSAMHYKNTDRTIDHVRRELGVDYIVEGSVRRADNRVRITANLIQCRDQAQLWAESFERELKDILALQSDVARAVAQEIKVALTPQEQAVGAARPVNPDAYQAYVKGRFFWNKRTPDALQKATEYFEEAVQLAPDWALAYVGLADSYLGSSRFASMPPGEAAAKARAAATKALELDPLSGEAHLSLAWIANTYDWDWPAAERAFKRALALSPNYATGHQQFALHLLFMGRCDEALQEINKAHELDPLSLAIGGVVGLVHTYAGDFQRAESQYRKVLELDPNFALARINLARGLVLEGKFEEAVVEARQATILLSDNSPRFVAQSGYIFGRTGHQAEAREILSQLTANAEREYVAPTHFALIYAGLDEKDQMFEWLEKAYQGRDVLLTQTLTDPYLAPVRSDPRFVDLVRRVGLPMPKPIPTAPSSESNSPGGTP